MLKHTPAPWTAEMIGSTAVIRFSDGYAIHAGNHNQDIDTIDANARLIAAAPELAEALRLCLCEMDYFTDLIHHEYAEEPDNQHLVTDWDNAAANARALLSRLEMVHEPFAVTVTG